MRGDPFYQNLYQINQLAGRICSLQLRKSRQLQRLCYIYKTASLTSLSMTQMTQIPRTQHHSYSEETATTSNAPTPSHLHQNTSSCIDNNMLITFLKYLKCIVNPLIPRLNSVMFNILNVKCNK